jgi:hypothetical protein
VGSRSGRVVRLAAQERDPRPDLGSARILIERLGGLCPDPSLILKIVLSRGGAPGSSPSRDTAIIVPPEGVELICRAQ